MKRYIFLLKQIKMYDIKIRAYPKIDEIPYLDIDKNIKNLDFICILDEGINIKAKTENGKTIHLCELTEFEALKVANAILSFFTKKSI